jgi:hypothetical protein
MGRFRKRAAGSSRRRSPRTPRIQGPIHVADDRIEWPVPPASTWTTDETHAPISSRARRSRPARVREWRALQAKRQALRAWECSITERGPAVNQLPSIAKPVAKR